MILEFNPASIRITSKEQLWELLTSIDYVPSLFKEGEVGLEGATKEIRNTYDNGSSLPWDLIDLVIQEHFDNIIALRSVNPDLHSRLQDIADYFKIKMNEMEHAKQCIEKANDS